MLPDWVLKYKRKGTAIHKIGNKYYLYEVTSKWEPTLKRARKITKRYLGTITPQGLIKPYSKLSLSNPKEYGAYIYLIKTNSKIITYLKKYFSSWWQELFILSSLRLTHKSTFKNMAIHYQDSWFSEEFPSAKLYEKAYKRLLIEVGSNRENIIKFLRKFILKEEALLMDLSHIFSYSANQILTAKGYNSDFDFSPQINLLFVFSFKRKLPLFYRILPGNVRDVRSLKATLEESKIEDAIIVADKGFYSKENIRLLKKEGLKFILPLKRNNKLINYAPLMSADKRGLDGYFKFRGRHIWYYGRRRADYVLWVYLDERLKIEEEQDYLNRIESNPENGYTKEGFHQIALRFGTIALLSNLNLSAQKIFEYFKSRIEIEILFDVFKNVLKADRSYMRGDKEMEAWMFINYLSLVYYYKIYQKLVELDLLKHYSVEDVLLHLRRVRRIKLRGEWIDLEIPKESRKLIEVLKIPIT